MNPAALLLVIASSSALAQAEASSDAASILAPVISNQIRVYAGEPAACVMRRLQGAPFEGLHTGRGGASAGAHVPSYSWMVPSQRGAEWQTDTPLPPDEARAVSEAQADIIRGPPQARTAETIKAGWLPKPLRLCADETRRPFMTFSAPAVRGDVAFVEAGYVCGRCGNGLLYALRRTGSEWRIVSVVYTWIS